MNMFRFSRRAVLLGAVPAACGLAQTPGRTVSSLRSLAELSAEDGAEIVVSAADVGGTFRWDARSNEEPDDGIILSGPGPRGRWVRQFTGPINARWFGASPTANARDNSKAFASASGAINRAGGGALLVPPGVYRVGHQQLVGRRGLGTAVHVADIIKIDGCARPVTITGTGAVLKAADGLRFGAFDPVTGRPNQARAPVYDRDLRASAYSMIYVGRCSGPVRIEGFELDGNQEKYIVGGEWDAEGRQLTAVGIYIEANRGGVTVEKVFSHDHGLDGVMVLHAGLTPDSPRYPVTLTDVVCDRNGRQGLSWVGGTQLTAIRCRFSRTGRGRIRSAPGAGVDVEAESSVCRNGRFIECEFIDNAGVGFVTPKGAVANMLLERCKIIGTTSWATWTPNPGVVFRDCLIAGNVIHTHADPDPRQATQFLSCRFDDDPKLSPTGKLHGGELANMGNGGTNVMFSDCTFTARTPQRALPWSPPDTRYHNCRFRQAGSVPSHTRGVFSGTCDIQANGPVDLGGSRFLGRVTLNGQVLS